MTQAIELSQPLTHWRLQAVDGIVELVIDCAASQTNTLDEAVLRELALIVDYLQAHSGQYRGLLLSSGKANGFIAGADINTIAASKDAQQLLASITEVHGYFRRFAALPLPKVALIDGFCLGGGLELALCCDYRVITKTAKLGLPEVKLGLHPGFGGTVRLPRLLSPLHALPMMLQGYNLRGAKAVKQGLADALVATPEQLREAGMVWLGKGQRKGGNWQSKLLSMTPIRGLIANKIEQTVAKKVPKAHYPAPFAIVDLWREYGHDPEAMERAEAESFAKLRQTPQSDALLRLYFLQERLKGFGKQQAAPVKHVHVIGAGVMGGDIAAWSAMQGFYTTLGDLSQAALDKAAKRAYQLFDKRLRDPDANREAKMRLRLDKAGWGLDKADLIIEAIVEKLEIKQSVFQEVLDKAKPEAIIATNTSSLKLEDIAQGLSQPERLLGLHFFNPVAKMPLVELVTQAANPQPLLDRAAAFVAAISRLPLPVRSSPGFLVNRVLLPYLVEALKCYEEGIDKSVIDRAAEDFGMPMGPIELADSVGLDVCLHIAQTMKDFIAFDSHGTIGDLVAAGEFGRKTGKGFYVYDKGRAQKDAVSTDAAQLSVISERLVMAYLNACAWCLRHEVVTDIDLLDAGCVFGSGFAPFRGGPMAYAQQLGYEQVVSTLEALSAKHGERFAPDAWWLAH